MATGTAQTYDFSTSVERDFESYVALVPATDVPILGTYNEVRAVPGDNRAAGGVFGSMGATEKKVEWQEYDIYTPHTTLGATVVTADTFITVASGQRERFRTGDVLIIESERLRVTGYGSTADTLTVTKGFAATTSASHDNGKVIKGLGTALAEGSDPENATFKDRDAKHNFTQIFGPYQVKLSGTQQVIRQYGIPSEMALQMDVLLRAIYIHLEQTVLYGERLEDTGNEWRTMGGLNFYITTNKDTTTTDLTYSKLLDQFQNAYSNGGVTDLAIVPPTQKRKISGFDQAVVRLDRSDRVRGQIVGQILSDFAICDLLLDRHVRTSDIFLVNKELVDWAILRSLRWEPLAKTGDSDKGQFLCEKSLRVRLEKRMAKFTALT